MEGAIKQAAIVEVAPYLIGGGILIALFLYLKSNFGAGTPDPGGGAPSTGILDGLLNNTLEIGSSSQNYTAAAQSTVTSPFQTAKSILGLSTTQTQAPVTAPAFLTRGQRYVVIFSCPRQSDPLLGDVEDAINQWEGATLSGVSVSLPDSATLAVSFTYAGDGTDTMYSQSAELANAVADSDSTLGNIAFLSASKG